MCGEEGERVALGICIYVRIKGEGGGKAGCLGEKGRGGKGVWEGGGKNRGYY